MKETIIIIGIIAIIITGDICNKKYLYKTSDELVEKIQNLKEKTITAKQNDNHRDEILKQINEIKNTWNNTTKMWSTIVMHDEIDNIEQALIKAKANIEYGELEVAIEEIETTQFFLEHVKDREKLSLKNIF